MVADEKEWNMGNGPAHIGHMHVHAISHALLILNRVRDMSVASGCDVDDGNGGLNIVVVSHARPNRVWQSLGRATLGVLICGLLYVRLCCLYVVRTVLIAYGLGERPLPGDIVGFCAAMATTASSLSCSP